MPRYFRMVIDDEDAFTDAVLAFVTAPTRSRNQMPVLEELHEYAPEVVPVLEHMVIDGVEDRQFIADYLRAAFGGHLEVLLN